MNNCIQHFLVAIPKGYDFLEVKQDSILAVSWMPEDHRGLYSRDCLVVQSNIIFNMKKL